MKLFLKTVALFALFNLKPSGAFGSPECGKVLLNKGGTTREAGSTLEGQWPWEVAIYKKEALDNHNYICGGTLVSKRHVITAAHCATKVRGGITNVNDLLIYLGKHHIEDSGEKVQVKNIQQIQVHPEFDKSDFKKDLAILELQDPVSFTDWVQPACLWPDTDIKLNSIVGQSGTVVNWSLNNGTSEQKILEAAVVSQETCIRSYSDFFAKFTSQWTYCAKLNDCFVSGHGMVFEKDGRWYLRGVSSLAVAKQGDYQCDPTHYIIFTDIAQLLPWIKDIVE